MINLFDKEIINGLALKNINLNHICNMMTAVLLTECA